MWILIIMTFTGASNTKTSRTTTVEFRSESTCQVAKEKLTSSIKEAGNGYVDVVSTCVKK